jgi:hypothetical protein
MVFNSGSKNVNDMIIASQNNKKNDKDFLRWIKFSRLEDFSKLDKGAFGIVYKASWNKSRYVTNTVAIKFFYDDKEFLKEVNLFFFFF